MAVCELTRHILGLSEMTIEARALLLFMIVDDLKTDTAKCLMSKVSMGKDKFDNTLRMLISKGYVIREKVKLSYKPLAFSDKTLALMSRKREQPKAIIVSEEQGDECTKITARTKSLPLKIENENKDSQEEYFTFEDFEKEIAKTHSHFRISAWSNKENVRKEPRINENQKSEFLYPPYHEKVLESKRKALLKKRRNSLRIPTAHLLQLNGASWPTDIDST